MGIHLPKAPVEISTLHCDPKTVVELIIQLYPTPTELKEAHFIYACCKTAYPHSFIKFEKSCPYPNQILVYVKDKFGRQIEVYNKNHPLTSKDEPFQKSGFLHVLNRIKRIAELGEDVQKINWSEMD